MMPLNATLTGRNDHGVSNANTSYLPDLKCLASTGPVRGIYIPTKLASNNYKQQGVQTGPKDRRGST